jgi:serine phosphatase RsbU (regulator of sigma subunit)
MSSRAAENGVRNWRAASRSSRPVVLRVLGAPKTFSIHDRSPRACISYRTMLSDVFVPRGQPDKNPLYMVARALAEAVTAEEVAAAVFDHALKRLGASSVGLWLVENDGTICYSGGAGSAADGPGPQARIEQGSDMPAAIAVRTGEVVTYSSKEERDARWPALEGYGGSEAVFVVPLSTRGRRIGVLHIGWGPGGKSFEPDLALLRGVSDLCAAALDRAALYDGERRARETLEFLHEGTRLMISALEPEVVVSSLVRLAVPRLGLWCAVYVAEGDDLIRVALEMSGDPSLAGFLRGSGAVRADADVPLAAVYRSGRPMFINKVVPEQVFGTYPPDLARRLLAATRGQRWSALVVPVQAGGTVIGVMSLMSPHWGGEPSYEVRFAAEGLAARAAIALRNAERYKTQLDNVRMLTSALLPDRLPEVDGLRLSTRYLPASAGVCGDWYEAELLADGEVLVGIGDASGHGIAAAAAMAQVRNAARALALVDSPLATKFDILSALVAGSPTESMVTALYGIVDPATGRGEWVSAGHPPPISLSAGGQVTMWHIDVDPPLGVVDRRYKSFRRDLEHGERVLLYTDGLFEKRGEDPNVGIRCLMETVEQHAKMSDQDLADALLEGRPDTTDDTCLLVISR